MATKKTAAEEITAEETVTKDAAEEAAEKAAPTSEWDEEVEMIIPRRPKGEDQQYYVCVNDRRFGFPANGKKQKLPKPIAEVLQQSLDAEWEAEEFAEEMRRKAMENARAL